MKVLNFEYFFTVLRPFPSCSKILFQIEAGCEVMWKWFCILMQIKLFFTGRVLHLASCTEWEFCISEVVCYWLHLHQSVFVLSGTPVPNNRKITAMRNLNFPPILRCTKWRHVWDKIATQDPRAFARRTKKKERLLVVYQNSDSGSLHSFDWRKSLWDQMSY